MLLSGSWAVCNIPVTFYNLIYKDCWGDVSNCIENKHKFPYEKYFNEEVLVSIMFSKLSLENHKKKVSLLLLLIQLFFTDKN